MTPIYQDKGDLWTVTLQVWHDNREILRQSGDKDLPNLGYIEIRVDGEWHLIEGGALSYKLPGENDISFITFMTPEAEMCVDPDRIQAARWVRHRD